MNQHRRAILWFMVSFISAAAAFDRNAPARPKQYAPAAYVFEAASDMSARADLAAGGNMLVIEKSSGFWLHDRELF